MLSNKQKVEDLKKQMRIFNNLKKAVKISTPQDEVEMYKSLVRGLQKTLNQEIAHVRKSPKTITKE